MAVVQPVLRSKEILSEKENHQADMGLSTKSTAQGEKTTRQPSTVRTAMKVENIHLTKWTGARWMVLLIIHYPWNTVIPSVISRLQLNTNLFPPVFWHLLNLNIPSTIDLDLGTSHQKDTSDSVTSKTAERYTFVIFPLHALQLALGSKTSIGLLPGNWDLLRKKPTTPNPSTMQKSTLKTE